MKVTVAGENSLIIYLGQEVCPSVSAKVQRAVDLLESALAPVLIDLVPSYSSLLVVYDLFLTDVETIRDQIFSLLDGLDDVEISDGPLIELPVYYSLESGPDLTVIAGRTGLAVEEIIALHQAQEYRVYAIGFAPGFAYLGQVDERIAMPRLATPRQQVPRGALGIADRQTAIYPAVSPGGWNLIGLCPTLMFDLNAMPSMPVKVGDRIRFTPIDRKTYIEMGGEL